MSETTSISASDPTHRPWHGSSDPWESVYTWFKGELAAAHQRISDLEQRIAGASQVSLQPVDSQPGDPTVSPNAPPPPNLPIPGKEPDHEETKPEEKPVDGPEAVTELH